MYDVLDISRYVINYSNEKGYGISNLKLQKLLYFIQAYFLVKTNKPCFQEHIEAWDFGPVVPEVYHEFKKFGCCNIPTIYATSGFSLAHRIKLGDSKLIKYVADTFSDYSATDLVALTHKQSPWIDAYHHGYNTVITNESIKEYFNE